MTKPPSAEPHQDSDAAPAAGRRSRRRLLSRISIQSKLLLMLLATSVLSAAVVGFVGYQSGVHSLRASAFERLTEIRGSQARQLQVTVGNLTNSLVVFTRGSTAEQAIGAFTAGFDELGDAEISPPQQQSIVEHYPAARTHRPGGSARTHSGRSLRHRRGVAARRSGADMHDVPGGRTSAPDGQHR